MASAHSRTPDAAPELAVLQLETAGDGIAASADLSPPGSARGGPPISSPFAHSSWQRRSYNANSRAQAVYNPQSRQQQQHVHWDADSAAAGGPAHSLPPGLQRLGQVGSHQQPDPASKGQLIDSSALSKPSDGPPTGQASGGTATPNSGPAPKPCSPAKPPSGRLGKPHPLATAASGVSFASSRDSLDGALGPPCSSLHSHEFGKPSASNGASPRRLSDSSVASDTSGNVAGYTSRGHSRRAVYIDEDMPSGFPPNTDSNHTGAGAHHSRLHGDAGHPAAASAASKAASRLVRQPSSAPQSPRRPRSSRDGDPPLQGAPRQRQHSWDGGTSPVGLSRTHLLGLAHCYAPGTVAQMSRGSPPVAAQPPEEPQFFDPSAHAVRLRAERSGTLSAAEPAPGWHHAPQRAATAASALPYPAAAAAAAAEAEAAEAAEAAHLARERRWRQQRRQLELSHARKRDRAKAKAAQQAAQAAAAQEAARQRGAAVAAALFALGAAAGLQLATLQQPQRQEHLQGFGAADTGAGAAAGMAGLRTTSGEATQPRAILQRGGSAPLQQPAAGSPLRRVSFHTQLEVPAASSPPSPNRMGFVRSPRASGSLDFAAAKAASRVALGAVRGGFERSGAAKLHLEGMAKQLPQGGSQATGQPAAVVTLALKRITHLRQAVFKAHYQYLLFLRNTFDKAAAGARRLADAMCQESRTLRRVLDIEVRETRVVCKGWSDRLSWLEASNSSADDEALRHVLMSVHGRLEGINHPFIQAVAALEDIFRALAPQGGLPYSSSAEQLAPGSPTRQPRLAVIGSPSASPRSSPTRQTPLRQRSASGSLNSLLQLPTIASNGISAAPGTDLNGPKTLSSGTKFSAPAVSRIQQNVAAGGGGGLSMSYQPAAALGKPQHPASGSPTTAAAAGVLSAADLSPQRPLNGPAAGQAVSPTQGKGLLAAHAGAAAGADVEADLQWQLMASLRQLDEARKNLAGRDTELKAMRARVALQNSYIQKLEDEQSGFAGGSECPTPVPSGQLPGGFGGVSPGAKPAAPASDGAAFGSSRLTPADWDARLAWD